MGFPGRKLKDKHIAFARSDRYHPSRRFSSSPAIALKEELKEAADLGAKIRFKRVDIGDWLNYHTTFFKMGIRLSPEWENETTLEKALTMRHELVHYRQWAGLGRVVMAVRYAIAEWRWAIEMQALRAQIQALVQTGATAAEIRQVARLYTRSLMTRYALKALDFKHTKALTMDLLLEVATGAS